MILFILVVVDVDDGVRKANWRKAFTVYDFLHKNPLSIAFRFEVKAEC